MKALDYRPRDSLNQERQPHRTLPEAVLWAALLVLLFVAFAARVWKLGAQSLWLDEALSVVFARPSLHQVLSILINQDLHPPLYYLALHFWMKLAGESEFSVRYVSVLLGLPVVPATYVLGRSLFRARATAEPSHTGPNSAMLIGLTGAILTALSPFLVYYAQEARMYSALVTFCVLSTYALWKYLETAERRWWAAYAFFTAAALYTQYFAALVIGFQVLYLIGQFRDRARFWGGASALGAAGLAYVPWLPAAYLQMQRLLNVPDFWKGDFQFTYLIEHVFAAFAVGQFAGLSSFRMVGLVAALLVGCGLILLLWRALRAGGAAIYLLAYLIVPFVALYLVLIRDPKFTERYLIMIAPPFYLVIGLGIVSLGLGFWRSRASALRWGAPVVSSALAVALVAVSLSQLWQVYYGPGYRKDDNRAAVAYIKQHYRTGDVVVLMMNTYQSFVYYAGDSIPYAPLQPGGDTVYAASSLNQITAGHKRIWLYLWNAEWADPTGWVRQALDTAYPQERVDQSFSGLGLQLFDITPDYRFQPPTNPTVARSIDYGNRMQLLGYDLPNATVASGDSDKITLYWKALAPLNQDYIVSLRLTDGQFYWWQRDDRPARFNFATMYWKPGQTVAGELPFAIPPGTPPGTYSLEVGIYPQGAAGHNLNVLQNGAVPVGTSASVATIQVVRPEKPAAASSLNLKSHRSDIFGQAIRLIGTTVETPRVAPGGSVDLTLGWQVLQSSLPNLKWQITADSGTFHRVILTSGPEAGRMPTVGWRKDDVWLDRERLVIPPDAPAGPLHFQLSVVSPNGQQMNSGANSQVDLGTTIVLDVRRLTTPPTGIQHAADWQVGDFADLIGYSASANSLHPGDHLTLTLYWRARGNSGEVPYTVFSHLLDSHSLIGAQQDHPPGNGDTPTTGWIPGEYVVDRYDLSLKPDANPGTYQIEVGMYDPQTGKRLRVARANGQNPGDRIILGTVEVR